MKQLLTLLALLIVAVRADAITIATTTSLEDSGLLAYLLPKLEAQTNIKVRVLVAGSGEALRLLKRGDVATALVHYPKAERAFVANNPDATRLGFMYSRFVLVGPPADPCKIAATTDSAQAFRALVRCGAKFVSRGDESGTHGKEMALWQAINYEPEGNKWYISTGSGMGESLRVAKELQAYLLIDIATWLNLENGRLKRLKIVFDKPDPSMLNPYSVLSNSSLPKGSETAKFINWFKIESAPYIRQFRLKNMAIFTPITTSPKAR